MVDDENNLVAGERRLRACRMLGWSEIPARLYSELTDDERREIELEENLRRKDLTPYERSKTLDNLVKKAAEVLAGSAKTDRSKGGRPSKLAVSEVAVSKRINVPQKTINDAQRHVAAVEKYPELAGLDITQKDVLTFSDWQSVLTTPLQYHACALRSMGKPSVGAPLQNLCCKMQQGFRSMLIKLS